jgi:tRNA uridine 5-carboxymethylaminomethyl modification enzyme
VPQRSEAYLGVLIDDLITRGTREPYRMFTSRAEHRLLLREDNADLRLTPRGREVGLVDEERWRLFQAKDQAVQCELGRLGTLRVRAAAVPAPWAQRVLGAPLARDVTALELLRRPGVGYEALLELTGPAPWMAQADERLEREVRTQIEVHVRYAGYIERAQEEIERARRHEDTRLPEELDYAAVHGLSHEVRELLTRARPATLGQAGRLPGITPAAVSILMVHLKKHALRARVA